MRFLNIIERKRDGRELDGEEIAFFVKGVAEKSIPDYQVSAFLMACFLNGLSDAETAALTCAMARTGETITLPDMGGPLVDKHSSGGVGDKTTLVVAPIAAACGLKVAKMSGRGLGFSGGTLDKLEAIPGFCTALDRDEFIEFVRRDGLAVAGQTASVAPVDKILYALRDATGTVESEALIASSIMSKKLAVEGGGIVLDVKAGSGAFMKTPEAARALAEKMVAIGERNGRRTVAAVTNMEQPLGRAVGNALEVAEAVETLHGRGPADFTELCYKISSLMLIAGGAAKNGAEAGQKIEDAIKSGAAFEKLRRMVINQGGNIAVIDDTSLLPKSALSFKVKAERSGFVESIFTEDIGRAAVEAGAGRYKKDDMIDYGAGLIINKKAGDRVEKGETLAVIYSASEEKAASAAAIASRAYRIAGERPEKLSPTVFCVIGGGAGI